MTVRLVLAWDDVGGRRPPGADEPTVHSALVPSARHGCDGRHRAGMNPRDAARRLAAQQDDVVSTAQCLRLGMSESQVRWMVDSERWQRLVRGVMVTHSGPVPWRTRARGALLYAGTGAALSHAAAAFLHGMTDRAPRTIAVTLPRHRYVRPQPDLRFHRPMVLPPAAGSLRVVAPAHTALDLVATARSEDEAIGHLCDALRGPATRAEIGTALEGRPGYRRAGLVLELLGHVRDGVESTLEHRYRRDVERAHRLPPAVRQRWTGLDGGWVRADCVYEGFGVRVELDGQLAHPGRATDADVWRDNSVVLQLGEITLRYRWRHVAVHPCETARQVANALRARGWRDRPIRCGATCQL